MTESEKAIAMAGALQRFAKEAVESKDPNGVAIGEMAWNLAESASLAQLFRLHHLVELANVAFDPNAIVIPESKP